MQKLIASIVSLIFGSNAMAQAFEVRDEVEWRRIVPAGAVVERVAEGFRFTEGPVWSSAEGGYLLFSDIPASRIYKYTPQTGAQVWREPSHNANGNTRDNDGRLISCHHGTRIVTRTNADGSVETLAERYQGKRLNSPNDVVVHSDGSIWFTDPPYGLPKQTEGKELDKQHVFRLDPQTRELTSVIADFSRPNGLCFSPDEKKLYIADSDPKISHIRVFDVTPDKRLTNGRIFCKLDKGVPDGIRVDVDGRLYSSAGDGVHVFAPSGALIGKILMPQLPDPKDPAKTIQESPANLRFGGPDNKTLFLTARTSLYTIRLNVAGAESH
jgi:gluconolactonase